MISARSWVRADAVSAKKDPFSIAALKVLALCVLLGFFAASVQGCFPEETSPLERPAEWPTAPLFSSLLSPPLPPKKIPQTPRVGIGLTSAIFKVLSPLQHRLWLNIDLEHLQMAPQEVGLQLIIIGNARSHYLDQETRGKPQFGGLSRQVAFVNTLQTLLGEHAKLSPPIVLNIGDNLFKTPGVLLPKDQLKAKASAALILRGMMAMKTKAIALGGRDLRLEYPTLMRLTKRPPPFISANIGSSKSNKASPFKPSILLRYNKLKVGVIGLSQNNSVKVAVLGKRPIRSNPLKNVAEKEAVVLRKKGADLIILMGPLGRSAFEKMIRGWKITPENPLPDLVLTSTHQRNPLPPRWSKGVPIVEIPAHSGHLWILQLRRAKDGTLIFTRSNPHEGKVEQLDAHLRKLHMKLRRFEKDRGEDVFEKARQLIEDIQALSTHLPLPSPLPLLPGLVATPRKIPLDYRRDKKIFKRLQELLRLPDDPTVLKPKKRAKPKKQKKRSKSKTKKQPHSKKWPHSKK